MTRQSQNIHEINLRAENMESSFDFVLSVIKRSIEEQTIHSIFFTAFKNSIASREEEKLDRLCDKLNSSKELDATITLIRNTATINRGNKEVFRSLILETGHFLANLKDYLYSSCEKNDPLYLALMSRVAGLCQAHADSVIEYKTTYGDRVGGAVCNSVTRMERLANYFGIKKEALFQEMDGKQTHPCPNTP